MIIINKTHDDLLKAITVEKCHMQLIKDKLFRMKINKGAQRLLVFKKTQQL